MDNKIIIPKGCYCYDANGVCPYWHKDARHEEQDNGYCSYLKRGDWDDNSSGLLWDQVKECNINEYTEEELLESILKEESDICNLVKDNSDLI